MPKTAKTDAAKDLARGTGQPTQASPVIARNRQSPEAQLAALKQRLLEISDLNYANAVLGWDQATYMPPGGAQARGRQSALLSRLAHERSIDPELGRLIDELTPYGEQLPYDSEVFRADPGGAAGLRQGGPAAGRLCRAGECARLGFLCGLDQSAAG